MTEVVAVLRSKAMMDVGFIVSYGMDWMLEWSSDELQCRNRGYEDWIGVVEKILKCLISS